MMMMWLVGFCTVLVFPLYHCLIINTAGLQPWNVDDSALVIYVTVSNNGNTPTRDLRADLTLCCLDATDVGEDGKCLTFQPLGDQLVILHPGEEHNFTIILPTVYPYERYGVCSIDIHYDSTYRMQHEIQFDTRLFAENRENLPESVKNMTEGLVRCPNPDNDPLRQCQPYECMLKYGANRGFYNQKRGRCETAPICATDADKTVLFSPKYSACINEELNLKAPIKGMQPFKHHIWSEFSLDKKYQKVCMHGTLTKNECECDEGWSTSTHAQSAFDSSARVYRLCNTMNTDFMETLKPTGLYQALVAAGFVTFVMLLVFCTVTQYQRHIVTKKISQVSVSVLREQLARKEGEKEVPEMPQYLALCDYIARVTIPNDPPPEGSPDLTLSMDQIILDLEKTDVPGIWKGTCGRQRGLFSVTSVEFYMPSYVPED